MEQPGGYRLKSYGIVCGEAAFEKERFAGGLTLAAKELPTPASVSGRPGVGFVILHQGFGVDYLILAWWDRENELALRVFVREDAGWRPARGGEGLCVWDLRVLWHEREAYVNNHNNEVRVTFDRHVRVATRFDQSLTTQMKDPFICTGTSENPDDVVILELKYSGRFPNWYQELVQAFNLVQGGAAKYAEGTTIYAGRHLAPIDVIRNMVL